MKRIFTRILCVLFSTSAFSQTTLVTNWKNNSQPKVTYKRGISAPGQNGFFDNAKTREFVDIQASFGMGIFNGIRNLFLDPETNEFYYQNGIFGNRQLAAFTNIRAYTADKGFELISQVGGTPRNSAYGFDTTYRKTPDPTFYEPDADFAPIPKEGFYMKEFQRNFTEWAINADKAVAPNFHSIWIGTQEIAHTIGFKDGIVNAANKKLNIERWVDYWKPISDALRNAGAKTGGIQLNSSNSDIYDYSVDYMIKKDLKLNYLTFQFYQWGDTVDLVKAVKALDRYNAKYPGTKIIIDRGAYGKLLSEATINSSEGLIYLLTGELGAMNHADKIYAYSLDAAVNTMVATQDNLFWKTRKWLNQIGTTRCSLSGMPANVAGFVTRNETKLSAAIWNRSNTTQTLNLKITNFNFGTGAQLIIKHARGEGFITSTAVWDAATNSVKGIVLKPFDYVLIDLKPAVSARLNELSTEKINLFPNPINDYFYVDNLNENATIEIYSLQGSLLLSKKGLYGKNQIDVSSFQQGSYFVKIVSKESIKTTSFIKL